jgi:hypothetical protein
MPYADTVATVRSWSEDRAIAVWTLFAGDLPTAALAVLGAELEKVRNDGASVVLVVPDDVTPTPAGATAGGYRRARPAAALPVRAAGGARRRRRSRTFAGWA